MTVDDVYKIILYAVKKNQNGSVTPAKFNEIINVGMRSWMAWMLGSFQTYQPGRPIAKVELGNNAVVRQRLSPCIVPATLAIDSSGIASYPADYLQTDTMYQMSVNKRIRYIENNQLDSVYNSVIDPIATNPIYLLEDNNFQFYPVALSQAKLRYVKDPANIVWGFTVDGNGREVYDVATSVQPIFDNLVILEIIVRALNIVGVNLQIGAVIQYSQEIKNTGQ